jgi:hypothetical protein
MHRHQQSSRATRTNNSKNVQPSVTPRLRSLGASAAAARQKAALTTSPGLTQWLSDIKLLDSKNFVDLLKRYIDTPDDVCDLSTAQLASLRRELKPGRTTRFDSALAVLAAARSGEEPSPSLGAAAPFEATMRLLEAATLPPALKEWAKMHRLEGRPAFVKLLCGAATEPQDLLDLNGGRPDADATPSRHPLMPLPVGHRTRRPADLRSVQRAGSVGKEPVQRRAGQSQARARQRCIVASQARSVAIFVVVVVSVATPQGRGNWEPSQQPVAAPRCNRAPQPHANPLGRLRLRRERVRR